jgi:hypothetical protein
MFKCFILIIFVSIITFAQNKVEKLNSEIPIGYNVNGMKISLPDTVNIKIIIFSGMAGGFSNLKDTIMVIYDGVLAPGNYRAYWDYKDANNILAPIGGIYSIFVDCSVPKNKRGAKKFSGYSSFLVMR